MPDEPRSWLDGARSNPTVRRIGKYGLVATCLLFLAAAVVARYRAIDETRRVAMELTETHKALNKAIDERDRTRDVTFNALVAEAIGFQRARFPGWRGLAIDRIRQATMLSAPRADAATARSVAVAALADPALTPVRQYSNRQSAVSCSAFRIDGERLAVGYDDGAIELWYPITGKFLSKLDAKAGRVVSIAFDPQTSAVESVHADGRLRIWSDATSSQQPRILSPDQGKLTCLDHSPDGSLLACGSNNGVIWIWSAESRRLVHQFANRGANVRSVAFSPDSRRLAVGGGDAVVRVWNLTGGREEEPCVGHTAAIAQVAFRSDGAAIISHSDDGDVRTWDAASSTCSAIWPTARPALPAALNPTADMLVLAASDATLRLINLATGEHRVATLAAEKPCTSVVFSPDGAWLATGDSAGRLHCYAVTHSECLHVRTPGPDVTAVAIAGENHLLATGASNATVAVTALPRASNNSRHARGVVLSAAYSPDGRRLAVACKNPPVIAIWNIEENRPEHVLWGHQDAVLAVAWSPDGTTLVSGSEDGTARLWNARDGAPGAVLYGHNGPINSVQIHPSGGLVATASFDQSIKLWWIDGPHAAGPAAHLARHVGYVLSVAFHPNGRQFASASADHLVRLWTIDESIQNRSAQQILSEEKTLTIREAGMLWNHTSHVFAVAYSDDGATLASVGNDRTVRLWDPLSLKQLTSFPGHSAKILSVAFDRNGRHVATSAEDGSVRIWRFWDRRRDAANWPAQFADTAATAVVELAATLVDHPNGVPVVRFNNDGDTLMTGCWDHSLRFWDVATVVRQESAVLSPQALERPFRVLSGQTRFSHSELWPKQLTKYASPVVLGLAASPDGRHLATSGKDPHCLVLWDQLTGQPQRVLHGHTHDVMAVAYSPDGRYLASASEDRSIRIWSVQGEQLATLRHHTDKVNSIAFSPDGRRLASASFDGTVRLWSLQAALPPQAGANSGGPQPPASALAVVPVAELRGHHSWVLGVTFSPDGKRLASCSADSTVAIWEFTDPAGHAAKVARVLQGHFLFVYSVAFSPDGTRLVSAGEDRTVRVWDAANGKPLHVLMGHGERIFTVAYHPDGKHVVAGSQDNYLVVWNAETGRRLRAIPAHQSAVSSLTFTRDGSLWTGSWDRTIRRWECLTGEMREILGGANAPIRSVAFASANETLLATSADESRRLPVQSTSAAQALAARNGARNPTAHTSPPIRTTSGVTAVEIAEALMPRIELRNPEDQHPFAVLRLPKCRIESIIMGRPPTSAALSLADGSIEFFDFLQPPMLHSSQPMGVGHEHLPFRSFSFTSSPPQIAAFSSAYSLLAVAKPSGKVDLWHVSTGALVGEVPLGIDKATALEFSPDGRWLAIGLSNGEIVLWDARARARVLTLPSDGQIVRTLAFDRPGSRVVSGGDGPVATVWNIADLRRRLAEFKLDW